MITITIEVVNALSDGSSIAQSQGRGISSMLNIIAKGISGPSDFERVHEIITNAEHLFDAQKTTWRNRQLIYLFNPLMHKLD